jgi:hypothetical protein
MTDTPARAERQEADDPVEPEPRAGAPDIIYLPDQSQPAPEPAPPKRKPGRRRAADPRSAWLPGTRCRPALRARLDAEAAAAGLSLGRLICVKLGDSDGPSTRRLGPPAEERDILVKLLAAVGKLGGNHTQLEAAFEAGGAAPGRAAWESQSRAILEMRGALMKALGSARRIADHAALKELLTVLLGNTGTTHNRLAHAFNAVSTAPELAEFESQGRAIEAVHNALMKVLGRGD